MKVIGAVVLAVALVWAWVEFRRVERAHFKARQEWDDHCEHPTVTGFVPVEDREDYP